tara:strand:+ start:29 stop:862 length:834 start_codon:yes stop_codon:yes gene_type:complete
MRLSISNIAWDRSYDQLISQILNKNNIDAIDIAPGKYFNNFSNTTNDDIVDVRKWWESRGIEIIGMQSLLYGTSGLNLFANNNVQKEMLEYLDLVCKISSGLNARKLVFGSPRNRDRHGLSDKKTFQIAINFFKELAQIAQKHNVVVCLEPNPECYGSNFMTTSHETAAIVIKVNHPCIKMQLDTGAIAINDERPTVICSKYKSLIGHIHLSEPNLVPLGSCPAIHGEVAIALKKFLPEYPCTIEMLTNSSDNPKSIIDSSIKFITQTYTKLKKIEL